ncbi:hypothetical protein [Priestia megaterium]|uniref:hypothetical protein n=1 Tax=Priestia megaterium TaxID=1404 RepID=UPI0035B68C2A
MEFYLLENGIDFLEQGLYFYEKYQDQYYNFESTQSKFDKNSYMKLTIICIQSSVEILTKKVLSDINELLIYTDISSKSNLLTYIDPDKKDQKPLHQQLIMEDASVHTIGYSESIERLSKIYGEMKEEYIKTMKKLGLIRNQLTHFGISRPIDYYEIIGTVNRALEFITDFFFEEKKLIESYDLKGQLHYVLNRGNEVEEQLWIKAIRNPFTNFVKLFEKACEYVNEINNEEYLTIEIHEMKELIILIKESDGFKPLIWSRNYPVMKCMVLLDYYDDSRYLDEPIVALMDYSEPELFYICKKEHEIEDIYEYERFWKNEKTIFSKPLDQESINWFLFNHVKKIQKTE